jgi:hypothetical protein
MKKWGRYKRGLAELGLVDHQNNKVDEIKGIRNEVGELGDALET